LRQVACIAGRMRGSSRQLWDKFDARIDSGMSSGSMLHFGDAKEMSAALFPELLVASQHNATLHEMGTNEKSVLSMARQKDSGYRRRCR
jgi:hypothetical protein